MGAGNWYLSLPPITAIDPSNVLLQAAFYHSTLPIIGWYQGFASGASNNGFVGTVGIFCDSGAALRVNVNLTVTFTWAVSDVLYINGNYEAA